MRESYLAFLSKSAGVMFSRHTLAKFYFITFIYNLILIKLYSEYKHFESKSNLASLSDKWEASQR